MEDKNERGKPGRKPVEDKKIPITVYIEESVITNLGGGWLISGKDKARSIASDAIYVQYETKKRSK
jgi:hypothetical protein